MDELAVKRVEKATSSKDVRPVDLLKTMIHDIESGKLKCDGLLLIAANRPENEAWDYQTYRCNMTYDQELVATVLAQERCIRYWLKR